MGEKRLRELGPATDFNRGRERRDLLLFLLKIDLYKQPLKRVPRGPSALSIG